MKKVWVSYFLVDREGNARVGATGFEDFCLSRIVNIATAPPARDPIKTYMTVKNADDGITIYGLPESIDDLTKSHKAPSGDPEMDALMAHQAAYLRALHDGKPLPPSPFPEDISVRHVSMGERCAHLIQAAGKMLGSRMVVSVVAPSRAVLSAGNPERPKENPALIGRGLL